MRGHSLFGAGIVIIAAGALLAACGKANAPILALPDLIVYPRGGGATYDGPCINDLGDLTPVPLEVCVENRGNGSAGVFTVDAGGTALSFDGLEPGDVQCQGGSGVRGGGSFTVDPDNKVVESDEQNNQNVLPVPSPPPFCTQTPPSESTSEVTVTSAVTDTPTPAPAGGQAGGLPDLIAYSRGGGATYDGPCIGSLGDLTPVPLQICVMNKGDGPAGPFSVDLGGALLFFDGLEAGEEQCQIATGLGGMGAFTVDPDNQVAESNEDNNMNVVPVPTQPPYCTPTPIS